MKTPIRSLAAIAAALVVASCASVESSSEYKALNAQVASDEKQLSDFKSKLATEKRDFEYLKDSQSAELAVRSSQIDLAKQQIDSKWSALEKKLKSPQLRSRLINEYAVEDCKYFGYDQRLGMGLFDDLDELREWVNKKEKWKWVVPESDTSGSPYPSLATFKDELDGPCKTALQQGEMDFYKQCKSISRMQLKKNPGQYKGECIRGSIRIAQFDSNTGPCSFQGYFGGGYDVRVQVGVTLDMAKHSTETDCKFLDTLVEDAYIEVWGFVLGSFEYSTTSGGSQTVPALKILRWGK
jgi:hypothetical protein